MFNTPKIPGFKKLKKLLSELFTLEKQMCWKSVRATKPAKRSKKIKIYTKLKGCSFKNLTEYLRMTP